MQDKTARIVCMRETTFSSTGTVLCDVSGVKYQKFSLGIRVENFLYASTYFNKLALGTVCVSMVIGISFSLVQCVA